MEGGSCASGGHVLGAAQEPRDQQQRDEKGAGAAAETKKGGGGMKFRVRAQAPHGVGALLLIGGAAVVGAAVLAWRRRPRHGDDDNKGGAVDQTEQRRLPAKEEEALDGGIIEDGKVQCASLVQKLDRSDENLSAGSTDIGSGSLDGNVSEESNQIHKEDEISEDRLESKYEERIDENSGSNHVEVHKHDLENKHEDKINEISGRDPVEVHTDYLDKEHVEKVEQKSSCNHVEITAHDMDKEHVEKVEQKSSCNHVEITAHDMCQDDEHDEKIDHVEGIDQNSVKIIMQEMVNVGLFSGSLEKVEKDSSKKDIEKEIAQKVNKDMEAPYQSKFCIKGPGIILSKHNDESDGTQEAESMENTPTAQLIMHQDQLLDDDMVTDSMENTPTAQLIRHQGQLLDDMVTVSMKNMPTAQLIMHQDQPLDDMATDSMENTPTAQLIMHQDQLLDGMITDTVTETEDTVTEAEDTVTATEDRVTETEEAKQGERTTTDKSELEQDEKKDLEGLAELASSPALSSPVKPIAKKEPEFPRPNESGMKIEQDYTNGELREHTDLISKGGAMQGEGDMATMDCRSSALVVIALIFALTMGITIIVRLYAPSRATKLQMDLP